jgi:hypothetical protein
VKVLVPFNPRGSKLVHSYRTNFPRDEYPISENGMWLNGRKDGFDWSDVIVKNGVAFGEVSGFRHGGMVERRAEQVFPGTEKLAVGEVPVGDYDDPTAVLVGVWGKNQHVTAKVFSRNPTDKYFQEVEIRLRSALVPHGIPGYEVFFRPLKTEKGYAEIVRWHGKLGGWTSLTRHDGPQYGVKDGDVVEATVEGNVIKGFINGVEVTSATDNAYASGAPGIGFNFGVGYTNADFGFRSFEVETYDD